MRRAQFCEFMGVRRKLHIQFQLRGTSHICKLPGNLDIHTLMSIKSCYQARAISQLHFREIKKGIVGQSGGGSCFLKRTVRQDGATFSQAPKIQRLQSVQSTSEL